MSASPRPKWAEFAARPERVLAVILVLAAAYLHILVLTHAGALWRDEIGTVNLATLPHFTETWKMLTHNADPILFPSLVRVWSALGFGGTDFGLRMLGFVIGISVVGAIWVSGRLLGMTWPVLSLALLTTSLPLVRWGDSLRPYGLGSALLLLAVGSVWSFISRPSRKRFLIAVIVGVLSAQSLYQNSFFLLATCGCGAVVCLRRKEWQVAMATLGIGLPAALSVVPYVPLILEAQSWLAVQKRVFDPLLIWNRFFDTLNLSVGWMYLIWVALILLAVAAGCVTLATGRRIPSADARDLPFFASLNLIVGTVGLLVFHRITRFDVFPWHWLPFMVFAAVNIEAALTEWAQRIRTGSLILVCLVSLAPFPAAARDAKCAHTSMDVVIAQVSRLTEAGDLIVIYPWFNGITFTRYYTGSVEWLTLPPVNDLRFHRYDLVKQDQLAGVPIKPIFDRVERALASGHRVWLVGGLPNGGPGETEVPSFPLPSPSSTQTTSFDIDYNYIWGRQMADFLSKHAQYSWVPPLPFDHCLIGYELVPLFAVKGWKNAPGGGTP